MPFRLVSTDGQLSFELRVGTPLVLGRALSSDLPVLDPTVSRRHAELTVESNAVALRDLGSSNGTFVNGSRISSVRLAAGDRVIFGKMLFELRELSPMLVDDGSAETMRRAARAGTTIIRQVPVPDADQTLERALRASGVQQAVDDVTVAVPQHERDRLKLTLLLEISKALTRVGNTEALVQKLLEFTARLIDVDQAVVLLVDSSRGDDDDGDGNQAGEPTLRVAGQRVRPGHRALPIPMHLAHTALREKAALLSDNPLEKPAEAADLPTLKREVSVAREPTPRSGAPVGLSPETRTPRATPFVRQALCAPLLGPEGRGLGVLYVDSGPHAPRMGDAKRSRTPQPRIDEEDLEFLVALAGIGAVALENLLLAERSRQEALIRSNFERFFAPHLAAQIAASPTRLRASGGERRRVAVLFSDIRDFTPLAARLTPDATARLLTDYFREMAECVFTYGGTLDKFIGDAVLAQWGAPVSAADDADRALEAARAMLAAIARLNQRWQQEGRPTLQVGLGLNYGDVFAGYLGSERRLEYTIIGDVVNTAARLCEVAQGGEILVAPALQTALTRPHRLLPHAPIYLRGRSEPLSVFCAE